MTDYAVLDLFCGLGGFSQAFEESDRWHVTTVDIEARFEPDIHADVFDLRPSDFDREFDVVLASPPCVVFSFANVKAGIEGWENKEPVGERVKNHVALVHHTVGLIRGISPDYWFLENPKARMRWVLGHPTGTITFCQYGRDIWKPTDLWGDHPPMTYRRCNKGENCHKRNPGSWEKQSNTEALGDTSNERAKVPYDLSDAIRDACEAGLDGEVPEQTTLEGINA